MALALLMQMEDRRIRGSEGFGRCPEIPNKNGGSLVGKSSRVIFKLAMFQLPEGDQSAGCIIGITTKFPRADLVFDTKASKVAGDFTIPGTSF